MCKKCDEAFGCQYYEWRRAFTQPDQAGQEQAAASRYMVGSQQLDASFYAFQQTIAEKLKALEDRIAALEDSKGKR